VLARRERAVMLQPHGKGIVLWTLRYGDEVRDPTEVYGKVKEKKTEPKLVSLVETLIGDLTRPWSEKLVRDPVQEHLKEIIAAHAKRKKRKAPKRKEADEPPEPASNVVSIMDALKKSISQEKKRKKG